MVRPIGLTNAKILALKAPERGQIEYADKVVPGLRVRVGKTGSATFIVRKRIGPRVANVTLGRFDERHFPLVEARQRARLIISDIEAGVAPALAVRQAAPAPEPDTFKAVSSTYLERHVDKRGLRTAAEVRRIFTRYIWPEFGDRPFLEVRRRAVTDLLDEIEDGKAGKEHNLGGPVQADYTLAVLSTLFTWYAVRDEDYASPIIRGMRRTKPRERARTRVIGLLPSGKQDDDELRLFWRTASASEVFGAYLQTCLLTGQRRAKVMEMRWVEIDDVGVWTIPTAPREKSTAGLLKLPPLALTILRAQPIVDDNPYVFAGRGGRPMYPGDKLKHDFDADLAKENDGVKLPHWTIHDLRRTAKTLMRRAGVSGEISERVLGHAIAGVEGVYDRHSYFDEKADALVRLAALIERVLEPASNVVPITASPSASAPLDR